MKMILKLDGTTASGGTPLVTHHERLADPLEPIVREIAAVSKKRTKTEADHMEIARLEFLGGMYVNAKGEPCLPSWNILRCLQDGAKRHKKGVDVPRGIAPLVHDVELHYHGDDERDPDKMWKAGTFSLRKTVGIQRSRTMRTRPIFTEWSAELPIEVDPVIFDLDTLELCWGDAGRYAGLGEMRPIYGRFAGTIEVPS
jgi:hypothetical protein